MDKEHLREYNKRYDYNHYINNAIMINESGRVVIFKNNNGYHYEGLIYEYLTDKENIKVVKSANCV